MRRLIAVILAVAILAVDAFAVERADTVSRADRHLAIKRAVAGAGVGIVVNVSLTELLKHTVKEMRPDRSDNRSFPSRHSSYAFNFASIASHQLYEYSPFWVTAAHTAANAVAMQRVLAERHYPGDVLAGAALGLMSTEIGYAVSRLFYGSPHRAVPMADNLPGLTAETSALINFGSHKRDYVLGCGVESSLRLSLPTSDYCGLGVAMHLRSQPVFSTGSYVGMLNAFGLSLNTYATTAIFDGRWALEGRVSGGLLRCFDRPCGVSAPWSYLLDLSAGLSRQLSRDLSVGGRVGCDLTARPHSDATMLISFFTKTQF